MNEQQTKALVASPARAIAMGLLLSFLMISAWFWHSWPGYIPEDGLFVATSPPPDVAIELDEEALAALTDAHASGFEHPDPGGKDPCKRLQLLPHKKLSAWKKQFRKRGFTIEKIKDMLLHGRRETFLQPEKNISYTRIYDAQGNWIIVDFIDCFIWQVAPHNFKK